MPTSTDLDPRLPGAAAPAMPCSAPPDRQLPPSAGRERVADPDRSSTGDWPATLHVVAWQDPLVDRHGYDPRSPYVETFWLPVLGPSTILLLRRLAGLLDVAPDGFDLDLDDTAAALGLGGRSGRHAPFQRTLERCITFAMAERLADTVAVRRHLPPLARRHLTRLPPSLQEQHDLALAARRTSAGGAGPTDPQDRARQLALSLLRMGEDPPSVTRQLARWGTHPAAAHAAVNWAVARDQQPATEVAVK